MNSFTDDDLKRESIISSSSSLSKDSDESQFSIILHRSKFHSNSFGYKIENDQRETSLNKESIEKVSCLGQFLFFGPLILCLILLISGIVLFIIVEQRNSKRENKEIQFNYPFNLTPGDNFMPIVCPFNPGKYSQSAFVFNELKCGLRRSSVIHIYYSNNPRPINPGENLTIVDVLIPPIIQLNYEFLSKINTKSFILIMIDPTYFSAISDSVSLYWIRHFSSSLEDEEDICYYRSKEDVIIYGTQHIVLLYATNSSKMMIRAKTVCNIFLDWFQLIEYVTFIKLKLIGSTNFFIPYVETSDDE